MTQIYRIALLQQDYAPRPVTHTHIVLSCVGECTVETWHYRERDAQREAAWRARYGERAEVAEAPVEDDD